MDLVEQIATKVSNIIWGPLTLSVIIGTGLFLTLNLKGITITKLPYAFKLLFKSGINNESRTDKYGISPFYALMTSLSATIGTGNIVGVSVAIAIGGPGALFWMWCAAIVGMATKFSEAVCAVHYREYDRYHQPIGGPMYYIKNGLSKNWAWLGTLFAVCGAIAGFGIGNTVQSNAISMALKDAMQVPEWVTAALLLAVVAVILIGGLSRISEVASKLVPIMALGYFIGGIIVLFSHISAVPHALKLVVTHALTPVAAQGGFAGATVWAAVRFGIARGVFSNEAGLGSAAIAHASAITSHAVKQGIIAMLGVLIDTLIICTITGLAIIVTGVWQVENVSGLLTSKAFEQTFSHAGSIFVSISLSLFAFTTILGWSLYSERCVQYLLGARAVTPFRILWVIMIPVGAMFNIDLLWLISDILNGLMAIPNLIALLLLSPVIFSLTREYFDVDKATN